jgi:hypothetical protein
VSLESTTFDGGDTRYPTWPSESTLNIYPCRLEARTVLPVQEKSLHYLDGVMQEGDNLKHTFPAVATFCKKHRMLSCSASLA